MKIITVIVRILLGLVFVVFGSNVFFHFIKMPPPTGLAGDFYNALVTSGYMNVVGALQVLGGLILIVGRFVPLGLTLLGPVIVNILCFHLFLEPKGLPMAIGVAVMALFLLYRYRFNFTGLLRPRDYAGFVGREGCNATRLERVMRSGAIRRLVWSGNFRILFFFMTKPACPMCEMTEVLEFPEKWECVTCGHEWERTPEPEAPAAARVVKDAHGNVLADGDCVVLIKDLKLGGGSQVLKGGSKSKPIRLVDGDHEISCKMDGMAIGLKACFVKKA